MLKLGRNRGGELPADRLDVVLDPLVVEHRQLLGDFGRRFAAEFHVVRDGVAVLRRNDFRLRAGAEASAHTATPSATSVRLRRERGIVEVMLRRSATIPANSKPRYRRMTTPTVALQKLNNELRFSVTGSWSYSRLRKCRSFETKPGPWADEADGAATEVQTDGVARDRRIRETRPTLRRLTCASSRVRRSRYGLKDSRVTLRGMATIDVASPGDQVAMGDQHNAEIVSSRRIAAHTRNPFRNR